MLITLARAYIDDYRQVMTGAEGDILVIGAGVSGLTTAVCLVEAGFSVRVWTRDSPARTTSCAAGAIWGPFLAAHDQADRWCGETLAIFEELATDAGSGVRMVDGVEAGRGVAEPPTWATRVSGFQQCEPTDLPDGFVSGWRYSVPVIDMPVYLDYLTRRLSAQGVTPEPVLVHSLDEAGSHAPVVVNCTGMGARELVPDAELESVRGQLVVVDNPGIDRFFADHTEEDDELTYILPQGRHLVLGGSAEPGRLDLDPDLEISAAILRRCARVEPLLAHARVLEHRVGLRPTRARIRVEKMAARDYHLLHNYGHGGSGVSLSWGCSRDIVAMVADL